MTGIASGNVLGLNLTEAANIAVETNKEWAEKLGINPAARITTGKPSGTTSLVLGCSSGVHAWHDEFYIRRIRLNKDEPIYKYLKKKLPKLIEDEKFNPHHTAVLSIPQRAPDGAILRGESPIDLLERVKKSTLNGFCPVILMEQIHITKALQCLLKMTNGTLLENGCGRIEIFTLEFLSYHMTAVLMYKPHLKAVAKKFITNCRNI